MDAATEDRRRARRVRSTTGIGRAARAALASFLAGCGGTPAAVEPPAVEARPRESPPAGPPAASPEPAAAALTGGRSAPPAAPPRLGADMRRRVTCRFVDTRAADVARFLAELSGVRIEVDPRLVDVPFSGSFRDDTLVWVVDRLAAMIGGSCEVVGGVVRVSPAAAR